MLLISSDLRLDSISWYLQLHCSSVTDDHHGNIFPFPSMQKNPLPNGTEPESYVYRTRTEHDPKILCSFPSLAVPNFYTGQAGVGSLFKLHQTQRSWSSNVLRRTSLNNRNWRREEKSSAELHICMEHGPHISKSGTDQTITRNAQKERVATAFKFNQAQWFYTTHHAPSALWRTTDERDAYRSLQ